MPPRRQVQRNDGADDATNAVSAILRIRPLLPSESERGEEANANALPDRQSVMVTAQMSQNRKIEAQRFRLDRVFAPGTSQRDFFHQSGVESFCDAALEGMAATVFCFGQTGSGKTYTMSGPALTLESDGDTATDVGDHAGLQLRAAQYMMHVTEELNASSASPGFSPLTLKASYIEIYNESVNDLLNETENLKLRWSQAGQCFFIEGLMVVQCDSLEDLQAVISEGNNNRKRATHKLNVDSSRSHCIFTVYVERRDFPGSPPKLGKIHFVDLAGSEKLKDSESSGIHGEETKNINRSLFALGHVISCLAKGSHISADGTVASYTSGSAAGINKVTGVTAAGANGSQLVATFVPYRDSTLTKLLMDSLGGNSKTLMIACITPSNRFTEESLRTITYAMRTKNIVNATPSVRLDPHEQKLYEMKVELEMLRKENAALRQRLQQQGGADDSRGQCNAGFAPPQPPPVRAWLGDVLQRSPSPVASIGPAGMNATGASSSGLLAPTAPSASGSFATLLRPGPFLLNPPGTAQSSASAPAALYAPGAGPTATSGLLPAAANQNSNWTTSSVRSLPPMASPLMPQTGGMSAPSSIAPPLGTLQQASLDVAGRIQKDNEELRKEVALLRQMILEIKSSGTFVKTPSSPHPVSSPAFQPYRLSRAGSMTEGSPTFSGSPAIGSKNQSRIEPPDGSGAASFDRRPLQASTISSSTIQNGSDEAISSRLPPPAPPPLTEFGFRPAPKKLQKLNF